MITTLDRMRFKQLIRQRCGLMCDGLAEETLVSALERRGAACALSSWDAYYRRLEQDEAEFQQLVQLLTINETYFYREADHLTLLTSHILPRLLAHRPSDQPIRILSAGCSSGEEPYSIAIALQEAFGAALAARIQIVGGDIDHMVLAKARAARYSAFSFRALPDSLRDRYFQLKDGMQFQLCDDMRHRVQFHPLNLLADPFPTQLGPFDVIFFRNVSIYFDEATRRHIQINLRSLLRDEGTLLIGIAETLANDLGVFQIQQQGEMFLFQNTLSTDTDSPALPQSRPPFHSLAEPAAAPDMSWVQAQPEEPPAPSPASITRLRSVRWPLSDRVQPENPVPDAKAPADTIETARHLAAEQKWEQARAILAALPDNQGRSPDAQSLDAWIRLQSRDFSGAERIAHHLYQQDQWSLDASVLLGLVAKWRHDLHTATRWLKHAVYARHECWVAHYYLAEIYRTEHNAAAARRSYRVALQHLQGTPDKNAGLSFPVGLPMSEVRFLCQRHGHDGVTGS